tara:strand:+ start:9570 stop:10367 length:798 start_codon:yes stop_codon:yes gene_type:complete
MAPLLKIINTVKFHNKLKKEDIMLATYPKSGTTWFRFILANIISYIDFDSKYSIDYETLNGSFRCSYDSKDISEINYESIPRFFATHRPYSALRFNRYKSVYILRNPGDVMISFYHYNKSLKNPYTKCASLKEFIRDEKVGIKKWCFHVNSWVNKANVILTYEGMKKNAFSEIKTMFDTLGIIINDNAINYSIEKSDFKLIKNMEKKIGMDKKAKEKHKEGYLFARKGQTNQWKEYLDEEDIQYINSYIKKTTLSSLKINYLLVK